MNNSAHLQMIGHVRVYDTTDADNPQLIREKHNAIHPQNMSRIIARALAGEANHGIYRIAFGNGGTVVDAAYRITYKTPNDGFAPDPTGWRSRLYNETYTEIVDENSLLMGTGPGAVPADDPPSASNSASGPGVTSAELLSDTQNMFGQSQVTVRCVLNTSEPKGQPFTDQIGNPVSNITEYTEATFTFDEIGLFSAGLKPQATAGYQAVNVGTRQDTDPTGLTQGGIYTFTIVVDNISHVVSVTLPTFGSGASGEILYKDLILVINQNLSAITCSLSTQSDNSTYGYLKFTSNSVGASSNVSIVEPSTPTSNWLFDGLTNFVRLEIPVSGTPAGVDNDATAPENESERLLSHLIFSPIAKAANRELTIVYTITVYVSRTKKN